jgi:hypothetical protein
MRLPRVAATAILAMGLLVMIPAGSVQAAKAAGCDGGGYTVLGLSGTVDALVASPTAVFRVQGKYTQFDVVAATFEVRNVAFLPTTNPLDMTGGVLTPVFASKNPLHGGTLTSAVSVSIGGGDLALSRSGTVASGAGLSMTLTAKDCAAGGIFQMEVERGDIDPATGLPRKTPFVNRLADAVGSVQPFYYDNQNFRDRLGQFLTAGNVTCTPSPTDTTCVQVTARVNIGNDRSAKFVARDSSQGGAAPNNTVRVNHPECGSPQVPTIDHCGGVSVWLVASGGRIGFVTGEDATEVANPPTLCTHQCQAQNRVRGRLAVLGFPFPVALDDRLAPRLCTPALPGCPL